MKIQKDTWERKAVAARMADFLRDPSQFRAGCVCGHIHILKLGLGITARQNARIVENVLHLAKN